MILLDLQPSWFEHVDFMNILIGLLIAYVCWSVKKWIESQTELNKANTEEHKTLHSRITGNEKELSELKGEHRVLKCRVIAND